MEDVRYKHAVITPAATRSNGKWWPVVNVRIEHGGRNHDYKGHIHRHEELDSEAEAQRRSIDVAKHMIDRGDFGNPYP